MSKLMSSLVAATIAGTFSLSAMAADAAPAAAEKPAAAHKSVKNAMKHTAKAPEKKADAAKQ
ncbi:MAG: hypothetical protein ABS93_03790 [Thiobacillus sp. SCN 62-729]|nr:MAG: hypothetical protein ABS93_03790 [Thiobacillus sp. SCN 62-729]